VRHDRIHGETIGKAIRASETEASNNPLPAAPCCVARRGRRLVPKRPIVLLAAVMITSIAVVQTRHESRQRFSELQTRQAERDALNVEWGKLLLEEGAWSQHWRAEAMARSRLNMNRPMPRHLVRVTRDSTP
jgi:cell division protein FtsL